MRSSLLLPLLLAMACTPDRDKDGFGDDVDCDETDPSAHPGAAEVCDGVDNDCDGEIDEPGGVTGGGPVYPDGDGDGHGAAGSEALIACGPPPGYATDDADCDDAEPAVNPEASELCGDGVDNDCDGAVDDPSAVDGSTFYADLDGDGWGGPVSEIACAPSPGYVAQGGDCNDGAAAVFPGADERCNGEDDDCDGAVDEDGAVDAEAWYADADGDGWGDDLVVVTACARPDGWTDRPGDCEDTLPDVNPDGVEVCTDGIDNDCDGTGNACSLSGDLDDDDASSVLRGASASDFVGYAVSLGGDLDGDGLGDLVVGATGLDRPFTGGGGAVVVYGGVASGTAGIDALPVLAGEAGSDGLGGSLAMVGDVDGDGYDELLLGARGNDEGGGNAGAAYLVWGDPTRLTGDLSVGSGAWKLVGEDPADQAGRTVAGAGDTDGDGFADLLVAARDGRFGVGAVYLIHGGGTRPTAALDLADADLVVVGHQAETLVGDRFGLGGVGDLDGDGVGDWAAGASGHEEGSRADVGLAAVFYGGARRGGEVSLLDGDARLVGDSADDGLGFALAGGGDTDGDGYDELLLGAWQPGGGAGWVSVHAGGPTRWSGQERARSVAVATLEGELPRDRAGWNVEGGDIDSDGLSDVVVSAVGRPGVGYNAGLVYLVYGGGLSGSLDLGQAAGATFEGTSTYGYFGWDLATGDASGDGYGDLLIGAYGVEDYRGAAWMFQGSGI